MRHVPAWLPLLLTAVLGCGGSEATSLGKLNGVIDIDGLKSIAPDDWILLDPSGEPLARLYKAFSGPQDGRWYWTVLFMRDGSVGSGGTGFTATGREAREACEERIRKRCAIDGHGSLPPWARKYF